MSIRLGLARWRTLTLGVSCLLHLGLIAAVLLAEQALSAHASRPPVLPVELVRAAEPPQPDPPRRVVEPPRPAPPPRPLTLPKPIATPMPAPTEAVSAPAPPPEPVRAPEPPAPTPPPAAAPPPPAPSAPVTAAMSPVASADREPTPAPRSAGSPTGSRGESAAASADAIALGRPSSSPGSGQVGGSALASASSRDTGATGAITRTARPQGGYQVRPGYPATARRLGIQGTTMLRVHVLVDGQVGEVVVQETAGHPDLDQAASEAVRRWRFEPARRGDSPVPMWVLLPIEFRLR